MYCKEIGQLHLCINPHSDVYDISSIGDDQAKKLQILTYLLRNFDTERSTNIRAVLSSDRSVVGELSRAMCYVKYKNTGLAHAWANLLARAFEMTQRGRE